MNATVQTTLQAFAGKRVGNYCTAPNLDVEILPLVQHCKTCAEVVVYNPKVEGRYGGRWEHEDGTAEHYTTPRTICIYCGTDEVGVVVARQHAWYDARECARCGGVDGYGIGD